MVQDADPLVQFVAHTFVFGTLLGALLAALVPARAPAQASGRRQPLGA